MRMDQWTNEWINEWTNGPNGRPCTGGDGSGERDADGSRRQQGGRADRSMHQGTSVHTTINGALTRLFYRPQPMKSTSTFFPRSNLKLSENVVVV